MASMPPPFDPNVYAAPPANKRRWPVIGTVLIGMFVVCGGLCGFGMFFLANMFGQASSFIGCLVGFEEIHRSILTYASENDGRLPKAETWQEEIRPYYIKERSKNDRKRGPFESFAAEGEWGCLDPETKARTGVAFNRELSGKKLTEVKTPQDVPLIFEIPRAAPNANEKYTERSNATAPEFAGKRRKWIVAYVEGGVGQDIEGMKVNIELDDDKPGRGR